MLGDAHFGDWGFQMGLLIVAGARRDPAVADLLDGSPRAADGAAASGARPDLERVGLDDLDRLYPAAAAKAQGRAAYRDRARRATAELQAGGAGYRALWRHFAEVTRVALERDFHALGVDFDLWKGESDVDPPDRPMVAELERQGPAGRGPGRADRPRRPATTTSASCRRCWWSRPKARPCTAPPTWPPSSTAGASFDPDLVLYCVDQRQADHFELVFRAAYLAGYAAEGAAGAHRLRHHERDRRQALQDPRGRGAEAARPDRDDPRQGARAAARGRPGRGPARAEEFEDTADKVGGGGAEVRRPAELPRHLLRLRPRPLLQLRGQDRALSALSGGAGEIAAAQGRGGGRRGRPRSRVAEPAERDLALALDAFDTALAEAYDQARAPHRRRARLPPRPGLLEFYAACPVLTAADPAARASRLALAGAALRQLEIALDLLGIAVPERM